MGPLGWLRWGCRTPLYARSPVVLLARRAAWNETRWFESIDTFARIRQPAWRWRAWMCLAVYWDIALGAFKGPPEIDEAFSDAFYRAFLREAEASVPGRVGGLGDIALVVLPVASIILRPPSPADDGPTHQVLIAYGVLDWIVEGQATTDPEVLAPLALDLARHSRHARELVQGLATQA